MTKIKLAYRRGYTGKKPWNEIVVSASQISKASDIVALSDCGVSVTSGERAQALVDFLRDALDKNSELIPAVKSVSRMGWNEEGFSPYVDGIVFDSADSFKQIYKAISQNGTLDGWLAEALDARTYSLTARIVLASSFASVLVEPLGCLPFFVHLWSMGSGTGKSVAQMLGAAVWANPTPGGAFFPTFKGTTVGMELMAGFLHSLPMFLDELQLAKDKHGNVVFNVYDLASGTGKLRGNKSLGLSYSPTWSNCFITSGETPIVGDNDGAGAFNRVIEIECKSDQKVVNDGHRTANALKANYGHAGKIFIDRLCQDGVKERAAELYEINYQSCLQNDTTEKQAMAASIIVTADQLATEWIFKDSRALTAQEIGEYLKSKAAVSASERGYEFMCDWVAMNVNKLRGDTETGDVYGLVENGTAYINRSVWGRVCAENSISSKALLSHLKSKNLIEVGSKGFTKTKRFGKITVSCVCLILPRDDESGEFDDEFPL